MRRKKALINIFSGVFGQLSTQVLAFVVRTVFIYFLGKEYLGINGLFTNILSILSLADLGVSSAITYYLYKPLANSDYKQIAAYMNFYKKVYLFVSGIIFIAGIFLIPFLPVIIKDLPELNNINIIYVLFLLNTCVSYLFSYNLTLLIADQKQYKTVIANQIVAAIKSVLQIYILWSTQNYLLYLSMNIIFTLVNNLVLTYIVGKEYTILKLYKSEKLSKSELNSVYKYIKASFLHKIGGVVVFNTDNLLISSFIGITYVGITSNYYMIIQMLNTFLDQVFNALIATIGNVNTENNLEQSYFYYTVLSFFSFTLFTICGVTLFNAFNPFISFWLNDTYILSANLVFLICFNFYLTGLRYPNLIFISTMGLQWHARKKPIIEALINIIASLIFMKIFGLAGVFMGTLTSTLIACSFYESSILYSFGFEKSSKKYINKFSIFVVVYLICLCSSSFIISLLSLAGFWKVGASVIISIFVSATTIILLFKDTSEFQYLFDVITGIIKGAKNEKNI